MHEQQKKPRVSIMNCMRKFSCVLDAYIAACCHCLFSTKNHIKTARIWIRKNQIYRRSINLIIAQWLKEKCHLKFSKFILIVILFWSITIKYRWYTYSQSFYLRSQIQRNAQALKTLTLWVCRALCLIKSLCHTQSLIFALLAIWFDSGVLCYYYSFLGHS